MARNFANLFLQLVLKKIFINIFCVGIRINTLNEEEIPLSIIEILGVMLKLNNVFTFLALGKEQKGHLYISYTFST